MLKLLSQRPSTSISILSQDTPNTIPTTDFSLIRRLKMDRVVSFLLWPFQFVANSGKWLARQMRPIRDEEKADNEDEKTDDNCCMVFLGIFGTGVSVGSLYYVPTQNNAV